MSRKPSTKCQSRVTTGCRGPFIVCVLARGHDGWHSASFWSGAKTLTIAWRYVEPTKRGPVPA